MTAEDADLDRIGRIVAGMTGLRHEGQFVEPNLDGTPGDYIGFESWEWPQGVGLFGLVRLWEITGRDELRALVEGWYARRLAAGLPPLNVNTTAPMLALALLWRRTGDPRWQAPLAAWAERVMRDLPRTGEGAFQHDVSDRLNPGEIWDDTLFMVALFLAAYGRAAGRMDMVHEAERQFLVHARYLTDTATGLWFHGWTFAGRHNFARARWARGNAWISVGIPELLDLGATAEPVRGFLLGVLATQLHALLPLQTARGAWRTLLDDPGAYEETSATAGFGYALLKAHRMGLGGEDWRQAGRRAAAYVAAQVGPDGRVGGVSYGTRMGHDLDFYRAIPIQPTGYGQALALLCLAEALNHGGVP